MVGLSRESDKESYSVAAYMKKNGYRIIPINPFADEVLDEKSYKSLLEVPADIQREIDVVDIFRKSEDVPPIVEQAIKLRERVGKPCAVWMQLGIINEEASDMAKKAGLAVVMDKCMMLEHKRLLKNKVKLR